MKMKIIDRTKENQSAMSENGEVVLLPFVLISLKYFVVANICQIPIIMNNVPKIYFMIFTPYP